jgi:hypothetical protein
VTDEENKTYIKNLKLQWASVLISINSTSCPQFVENVSHNSEKK